MNGIFKRINPYIEAHTYGKNVGEIIVTFFSKWVYLQMNQNLKNEKFKFEAY